ncbi:hypothetical protein [Dactylosporangium salmoneum]|uniref:Uncharacterized protein n=1 Tax=Dactylosporangium salmoneum TaxID=53361 RepID=A0ABP5UWB3_9ACTN
MLLIDQGRVKEALALFATEGASTSEADHAFWQQFHRNGQASGHKPPPIVDR